MSLIQYCNKPAAALNDEFLNAFFGNSEWLAAWDVSETKDQYTIKMDLPGLKKEDIKLSFEDGVLTIAGERKSEMEDKESTYHRVERAYGHFRRSLKLGDQVNTETIKANYKDGVLEVVVAKLEKARPQQIDIKVE